MKQLGDLLRDIREAKNLKQKAVADALNISNKQLSSYERNVSSPPADIIKEICEFYNVSADYLLQVELNRSEVKKGNVLGTRSSGDYNIVALTPEQKKVLRYYERLDDENKEAIRGMMILYHKEQDRTIKKNH